MRVYSFGASDGFPDSLEAPAFMVSEEGRAWLVDVPTHANLMLREIGLSPMDLTAVFVTHMHNDHIGGLIDLIQLRMICLAKPDIMREAGYFSEMAAEVLPIYILGCHQEWWESLSRLIDFNCPSDWGDWRDYHQVFHVPPEMEEGSFQVEGLEVFYRRTAHDVPCCGIKVNGLAISGDGPYTSEHMNWLACGTSLVFHEAGYAGSHTRLDQLPQVLESHSRVFFYHMPYPVKALLWKQGLPVVEKQWYRV